jgi:hypothetical protein
VFDEDVVRHYQLHLTRRRQLRPNDEYRGATEAEWQELEGHFDGPSAASRRSSPWTCSSKRVTTKIVRNHPTLNASYLDRVSRMQELVLEEARTRTGWPDPADPRAAAIVGAAFSCLIAAWTTWLTTNQALPFGDLLDQAMGAIQPI